jgi:SNF2 family DNA or RNA helicase
MTLTRFKHQIVSANFMAQRPRCFNHNDPGTGKTITAIDAFHLCPDATRVLVLAPLSILRVSWADDIEKVSDGSYSVAHGTPKKREQAFTNGARFVIANHDAVNWIAKNPKLLAGFSHIIVDEYRAFKSRSAQRSKHLQALAKLVKYLWLMSGSPNTLGLCDLWFPALLLDGGARLGRNFWEFRAQVCQPKQVGPRAEHIQWVDRPGAELEVAAKLKDISIRYELADCIDMPDRVIRTLHIDMPPWLETYCKEFSKHAFLELDTGNLNAINAGAKKSKLMQMLSGAVYDYSGAAIQVHDERYKLVMDLVEERKQSIVGFNWKHELRALEVEAASRGIKYGVINGDVPLAKRTEVINAFQTGELQTLFLHPRAAGHGITLTNANAVIWCSPTEDAELFIQLNARVYRNGQKNTTEVICIAYKDSPEITSYERLQGKITQVESLLELFAQFSKTETTTTGYRHG